MRSPFFIGALGAAVALRFAPGASWWERASNVVAGALFSGYLSPALVEWLHLRTEGMTSASAFVVGLLGMSLAAAVLQAIKSIDLAKIASDWLGRRP